jgi:hypothetical protein
VHSSLEEVVSTLKSQPQYDCKSIHSTLSQILLTLKSESRADLFGLIGLFIFIFLLEGWSGSTLDRWTDKAWDSFRYDATFTNITVEKRPSGCDFLSAPLGLKGCQYKKHTSVFGGKEREALIQQAITTEGKQTAARQPNSVTVFWERQED